MRRTGRLRGAFLVPSGILVLAAAPPAVGQPVSTLDLAVLPTTDTRLERVYGAAGTGRFGVPVAGGGDVDGDGLPDLAVAHLTASPADRSFAGEIDVVFGNGEIGRNLDLAEENPSVLRIYGAAASETAGSEIWMDDVTGDGIDDLLICRQNFSPPGRIGAGALTLVVGGPALRDRAAALAPVDLATPPPELTLTTLVGAKSLDRLGIWARTGDVDGDGIADLVVAADQEDGDGETNRGAVYVVRGGPHLASGGSIDLAEFGSTPLAGHLARILPPPGAAGFHLGATCQIADLDGNGRGEVLAAAALNRAGAALDPPGAPGAAEGSGGAPGGTLYIVWDDNFPDGVWPAGFELQLGALPGGRSVIRGEEASVAFGEEIVGGADFDGDGEADLFAGDLAAHDATGLGYIFFPARRLRGQEVDLDLSLPPGLRRTRIRGPSPGAIAADTAAHGDFDGDGLADLAFAAPRATPEGRLHAGTIHVFFGRRGPWPAEIDTTPGQLPPPTSLCTAVIEGAHGRAGLEDEGDTLAYSAAVGDLDGDGLADLITNEMLGNGVAPDAVDVGNLLVLSGAFFTAAPHPVLPGGPGEAAPRPSRSRLLPRRLGSPPPTTDATPKKLLPCPQAILGRP